ncbi:MAG: NAD(P)/FAD-dependent oxidoreductase [Treponema sp.]|jgi:glycerol-3-phosphate dehydrogenase|nr:NAD(P)/FAD-dependent oxidoreductase [Treponema sp.]
MYDVVIIGCGITGAAAAWELSKYNVVEQDGKGTVITRPIRTAVLDKENDVSCGASKANSAVIHAGYDPPPGTLMARLNVEGNRLAAELCEKLDVPHRKCGSMVLAFSPDDKNHLLQLYNRGIQNGVSDIEILDGEQVLKREPRLNREISAALFAPAAMIISPWEYVLALIETACRNGTELFLDSEVLSIGERARGTAETGGAAGSGPRWIVKTAGAVYETAWLINAAGVHSDKIHNMAAPETFTIYPYRGEYYLLDKSEGGMVNHVIFQCPTAAGKGVLIAPTVHGNLITGPNGEACADGEDTATTGEGLLAVRRAAVKSVPSLNFGENIRNFSGIRAASNTDDFIVKEAEGAPGFIDLAGIKSPGLSAAPAIAALLPGMLGTGGAVGYGTPGARPRNDLLHLEAKEKFIDTRSRVRFAGLSTADKSALIKTNPAYGRVMCRCETVTEGEILDALAAPIPPHTIDAVKRRCNPGMGRCQGGFCAPRILELLASFYHVDPETILQDSAGSYILSGETGESHGA